MSARVGGTVNAAVPDVAAGIGGPAWTGGPTGSGGAWRTGWDQRPSLQWPMRDSNRSAAASRDAAARSTEFSDRSVVATEIAEQAQDLQVQPDQADHEAERTQPR